MIGLGESDQTRIDLFVGQVQEIVELLDAGDQAYTRQKAKHERRHGGNKYKKARNAKKKS